MTVIALVQHKGGAGKTTATLGLALVARESGKRCAVVDLDPQRLATRIVEQHELGLPCTSKFDPARPPEADLIWIDTPGLQVHETAIALAAADVIVVPLRASMLDWYGSSHVLQALAHREKPAIWLPSQIDARRSSDRELVASLQDAMKGTTIPRWPILPGIKSLASVAVLLQGDLRCTAADNFRENYKKLKRYL